MRNAVIHLSLLGLLITPKNSFSDVAKFTSKGLVFENIIITTDSFGREQLTIDDLSYQKKSMPYKTDLVLSFNSPSSLLVKDDTDKYNIRSSLYSFVKGSRILGGGCANFYKSEHRVEIELDRNLWLGSCDDLGSFTLEFRLFPLSLKDESILFSRIGYLSGEKNGIEIVFKQGRISPRLYGVFKDDSGRRYNIFLNRGRVLEEKKWYHFCLSFDRVSWKLAKYLNGEEEDVLYLSKRDDARIGIYKPSFACEDLPLAILGKNYYGYLDEFRISYFNIQELKGEMDVAYQKYKEVGVSDRIPINTEGVITSPVYSFPSTGTSVKLFKWSEIKRKNTFVWMEFRISDNLFLMNNTDLRWYRIGNNQKNIYLMRVGDEYLRGKYYQWRAHLVPSPDGKYSPSIYDVELRYKIDSPPNVPVLLKVIEAGDKFVRLKWKKNVELDIFGYKIYYGVRSRRYDGMIQYINGKRISNTFNNGKNYIEVDITNNVINENRKRHRSEILTYPVLKNSVLYFFSISAYDSYKPDTIYNHESKLSNEVSARPFAGSEINK